MEGIDPNPDNYVAGAILSTSTVLVGCLLRLEPNKQTEVCMHVYVSYIHVCVCMCACACACVYACTCICTCASVSCKFYASVCSIRVFKFGCCIKVVQY